MNHAVAMHLNRRVDEWCSKNKTPLFGFDADHSCTSDCIIVGNYPYFMCVHSRQPHACGPGRCSHTYKTSEGTFCRLSGFEIQGPEDETSTLVVRDSTGRSTRHWGDKIRKGKRPRRQTKTTTGKNAIMFFERAVRHFLVSEERQQLYRNEMDKFRATVLKNLKRHPSEALLSIDAADKIVSEAVDRHLPQCNPPPDPSVRWLDGLAYQIFQFWTQLDFKCTRKSVNALVAVSLSLMAKKRGYCCDGVVYVHHSPTVARHVVTDMQFGKFTGITCRRMSIIQRDLMKSLLTPSGSQRIITPLFFSAE